MTAVLGLESAARKKEIICGHRLAIGPQSFAQFESPGQAIGAVFQLIRHPGIARAVGA